MLIQELITDTEQNINIIKPDKLTVMEELTKLGDWGDWGGGVQGNVGEVLLSFYVIENEEILYRVVGKRDRGFCIFLELNVLN